MTRSRGDAPVLLAVSATLMATDTTAQALIVVGVARVAAYPATPGVAAGGSGGSGTLARS